ncbi:hypothetical protein MLD38_027238 [Melastoma candidum]|uniref:Uncharacterized protein n=1 Tax=Melastoma candidum TaxID=119954 RepID=A0ACB9P2R2_9MYRT|nr:hypothetical protein MLD38_027238 [Melastoma candidum]
MSSIILNPFQLLEINIISAQDLAKVSRSMRTYAIAWVHPDRKLSTRVDPQGRTNPSWNDKFVFRVDEDFLLSDTSGVMIEIYSVHWFRDVLVGTVRVLVGNLVSPPSRRFRHQQEIGMKFVALQVRRPSGRPQGILNIGVALLDSSMRSMPLYTHLKTSAVGYRDLMGEHDPHHNQHLLHYHNQNQGQGQGQQQQQRQQPLALPAPKPELRRTKSDTSSMVQTSRALKRKVSFRERPGSVVGLGVQDTKSTVLSVSDIRAAPAKRGKSYSPGSDVGSSSIMGAVRNKWLGRTEAQQKKTKPKGGVHQPVGFDGSIKGGNMHMTDSELGPSPSEVAGKNVYRMEGERSVVGAWSGCESVEGLQSKLERWKMELPPVYDSRAGGGDFSSMLSSEVNNPSGGGRSRRKNKRRHADPDPEPEVGGGGLFSCMSNICGCQCSIVCGE